MKRKSVGIMPERFVDKTNFVRQLARKVDRYTVHYRIAATIKIAQNMRKNRVRPA